MIRKNVADIIHNHDTYELECIDRMYLNGYVPRLQTGAAAAFFIRQQFDCPMASTAKLEPMTRQFVDVVEHFVDLEELDSLSFRKGERKDDIAKAYLADFEYEEGVLFVDELCGYPHNLPNGASRFMWRDRSGVSMGGSWLKNLAT